MSCVFLKHPSISATLLKTVYKLCFKLPQAVLVRATCDCVVVFFILVISTFCKSFRSSGLSYNTFGINNSLSQVIGMKNWDFCCIRKAQGSLRAGCRVRGRGRERRSRKRHKPHVVCKLARAPKRKVRRQRPAFECETQTLEPARRLSTSEFHGF